MTAREFLVDYYGTDDCCVNYKPYEHSRLVQSIRFDDAVKMLEKDIEEMTDMFIGAKFDNPKMAAEQGAFRIWKNYHLVKF